MQGAIHRIRPQQPTARPFKNVARTIPSLWKHRARLAKASQSPAQALDDPGRQQTAPKRPDFGSRFLRWAAAGKGGIEKADGENEWSSNHREESFKFEELGSDAEEILGVAAQSVQAGSGLNWMDVFRRMQRDYGKLGVWRFFELLIETQTVSLLFIHRSDDIRDEIVTAAVLDDARLTRVVDAARDEQLRGHHWPDLWASVLYSLLKKEHHTRAFLWHTRLARDFPPDTEVFGSMLSVFVTNRSHEMQQCISAIYILNEKKVHYDRIVPALWEAGLSGLARTWRATLTYYGDFPSNQHPQRSRHFLEFICNYYPRINLTEQEQKVLDQPDPHAKHDTAPPDSPIEIKPHRGQSLVSMLRRDSLLAKWFASSFITPQLAINFAHRLGVRNLGPLSFQSLALREHDAASLTYRVSQLERLGISLSDGLYTKALMSLAKAGADKRLQSLIKCDIHPEEFDDAHKRKKIREAAVQNGDSERRTLIDLVESFSSRDLSPHELNDAMARNLKWIRSRKALVVLDRMNALKIRMTEANADKLLSNVFWKLGEHTSDLYGDEQFLKKEIRLDRAIRVIRHVAGQKLPVPVYRWKTILNLLGRSGRFEELEQICLEICQHYRPAEMGLLPVHHIDNPRFKEEVSEHLFDPDGEFEEPDVDGKLTEKAKLEREGGIDAQSDVTRQVRSIISQEPLPNNISKRGGSFEDMMLLRRVDNPLDASVDWDFRAPDAKAEPPKDNADASLDQEDMVKPEGQALPTFIPADLPFTHRQHPVQLIFDVPFQRSLIRWTYDKALASKPGKKAKLSLAKFDVAGGVMLLKLLQERGVYIDIRSLQKAVTRRMAIAKIPQRRKSRSRDEIEASPRHQKNLVDAAWGSALLPSLPELERDMEKARLKLWRKYAKNFVHYDPNHSQDTTVQRRRQGEDTSPRHVSSSAF